MIFKMEVTSISLEEKVKIYSNLARHIVGRLFLFIRGIDKKGEGRVKVSLATLMKLLPTTGNAKASRSTIYRWLHEGLKAGYFRSYKRQKDYFVIYYSNPRVPAYKLQTSLGAISSHQVKDLVANNFEGKTLRETATCTTAHHLEKASQYSASKNNQKGVSITNADQSKRDDTQGKPDKNLLDQHNSCKTIVAIKSPFVYSYGATQNKIAETLDISERTVRRHLKGVKRVQPIKLISDTEAFKRLDEAEISFKKPNAFYHKGNWWKWCPNIYVGLNYDLKHCLTERCLYETFLYKKAAEAGLEVDKNLLSLQFGKSKVLAGKRSSDKRRESYFVLSNSSDIKDLISLTEAAKKSPAARA